MKLLTLCQLLFCQLPCPSEARNEVKSEGGPTSFLIDNNIGECPLVCKV